MKIRKDTDLWTERFRPQCAEDYICTPEVRALIDKIVKTGECPNLLFFSKSPGSGKTSLTQVLTNELGSDVLKINGSKDTSIEVIRMDVNQFCNTVSVMSEGKKIVILDECLSDEEEVLIGDTENYTSVKLKDLEIGVEYPIISFNMDSGNIENDIGSIISDRVDEIYEVELSDGRKILLNKKHPLLVKNNGVVGERSLADGLSVGDKIVVGEK